MNRPAILVAILLCVACNESSPTSPLAVTRVPVTDAALNGVWIAELGRSRVGEMWGTVRVTLSAADGVVTGEAQPASGPARPITGRVEIGHNGPIAVFTLVPGTGHSGECDLTAGIGWVEMVGARPRALLGSVSGRCPGTFMGDVRLDRV